MAATTLIFNPKTKEEFDQIVSNTPFIVLVDFWAEWCGPCNAAFFLISELLEEQNPIQFILVKVNVEELDEFADAIGVQGIPDLRIIKNGAFLPDIALIGTKGKEKIRNFLQDNGVTFPAPANN